MLIFNRSTIIKLEFKFYMTAIFLKENGPTHKKKRPEKHNSPQKAI